MKRYTMVKDLLGRTVKTSCRARLLPFAFSPFYLFTISPFYLFTFLPFLSGCSVIDEDLSDCGEDYNVKYEVVLKTNLITEIHTVLRLHNETEAADLLEDSLKMIFREFAHDVDLSFYKNNECRFHDEHIMDANQAVYELTLPADDYRHLALANIQEEQRVQIDEPLLADQFYLEQEDGKIIEGHTAGLFTARENMDILSGVNQNFTVSLYMVNCASAIVVRTNDKLYDNIWVESCDFADGFLVNDSIFTHRRNPMIRDKRITTPPAGREVFYAVNFPSCDTAEEAHAETRADGGRIGSSDAQRIWRKYVYVRLPNGSVTRTEIGVRDPLKAGQVKVIVLWLNADGSVYSKVDEVSTSVTLDWQEGLVIEG